MNQPEKKPVSIIVAMTSEKVIGIDNSLPWKLSEDLKLFRQVTTGNTVIMGRKTFESIGKPLPARVNFVITSNAEALNKDKNICSNISGYSEGELYYFNSLEKALKAAESSLGNPFIIGGVSIYKEALPFADKLYISFVKDNYPGNMFFPEFDLSLWQITEEKDFNDFVFKVFERKN